MGRTLTICLLLMSIGFTSACGGGDEREDGRGNDRLGGPIAGIPAEEFDHIIELFNRGVGLMDRYQPVEAIKEFEQVVALAPQWTTGRLNYGIALLNGQSDKYQQMAETELTRVIEEDSENPYAHYALGMLFRHLTRFDEAKAQFEHVLRIDPDDPDAHYQLGILLIDSDPAAARAHLETTLAKVPHHESACYRLQGLLRRTGENEKARELLLRFKALKSTGAGVFSGMKYGEMGHYAEIVRTFDAPLVEEGSDVSPVFADFAQSAGLDAVAGGTAGWPGDPDAGFGPGVAVSDIDGDGDLDICFTGIGNAKSAMIYVNDGGELRFTELTDAGVEDASGTIGAFFGDADKDGDPDLYITCDGPNRLYRNDGQGHFIDVTEASGTGGEASISVGASWADADHDGDLDIYVANYARSYDATEGTPNALWRNNGDGTFTNVAAPAGIDAGNARTIGVTFFDVDDDRDLDLYLINDGSQNRLFLNDRIGRYTEATSWFPELADSGGGLGVVLGDFDLNGRADMLLLRGERPPRLLIQIDRGRFVDDESFNASAHNSEGAVGALAADLDIDGDLDLVLLGAGAGQSTGHRIMLNSGDGRFATVLPLGPGELPQRTRGAVAADFDGDGVLELLVAKAGAAPELWRTTPPADRHWLTIVPSKAGDDASRWCDPRSVGLLAEVKTGRRLQVANVTSSEGYLGGQPRRVHLGLGTAGKADYIRLAWPDGVLQSELEVAADQQWRIAKVLRKPSSCPVLFAWDGERFEFITDFLGVGGVGFFIEPGLYAPPDPTEDVRIPPKKIQPRDGKYLLRIAEPLEEVTYLDELHLIAYDHPSDRELYPDERFTGSPPFPTGQPFAVADRIFPESARNTRGNDVLGRLLAIDRAYVDPPIDPRFVGYAEDHWLELDFGDTLRELDPDARLVLYLYGWVEYTYSHVNYAAIQAGLTMMSPRIEAPDGDGGWRVVMDEMGFPAGLPRMMTIDITDLPIRADGRLRIRTNMEVFWDQIFVGVDVIGTDVRTHTMRPIAAELRQLGYPREYSPDGSDPTLYDYQRVDQGVPFKILAGAYTRLGDVRPLLESVDDQFVIMARGEELAVEFDATSLPALPSGWTRTLVLHADGYCKDMDLYTAFPDTVGPLPYHGMENYPPSNPAARNDEPDSLGHRFNTRRVRGR